MLAKGKLFLREGMHGDEKVIEGYVQNVDPTGAMLNSKQDGMGVLTIYPPTSYYKIEVQPKMASPGIMMPNIMMARK